MAVTVCALHIITGELPDSDRTFPRVPCIGEDVYLDASPDTFRVVRVIWAMDKPLLELSRVVMA
jgi:hypothetical protein